MVVKIQVEVFWAVTLCSAAIGYHHFGDSCCLHLHGEDGGLDLKQVPLPLMISVLNLINTCCKTSHILEEEKVSVVISIFN
jgi:hypothetical protein